MNAPLKTIPCQSAEEEPVREPPADRKVGKLDHWLLRQILHFAGDPEVDVRLWDEAPLQEGSTRHQADVVILDRATLWKLIVSPDYQFAEGYVGGHIDINGDLVELCERIYVGLPGTPWWNRLLYRTRLLGAHTLSGAKRNIHEHYDLGNDFYQLWLDERLLYTCAYFPDPKLTLEAAQIAKMDHVCRKLRLVPGQEVAEAGCGWGALALHMARKYGVRVRAWNISHEQVLYAREQAQRQGLGDRVEFIEDDWRNMDGTYDAFVSVGMLEHVGVENYRLLGDVIHRCLKKPGMGLIHSIGKNVAEPLDRWIEKRIFPGAQPPSLRQMSEIFEGHRFSILDVENLRLHYAETLRHWLKRYEQHVETVRGMHDELFVRAWRLYLAGSVAAFTTGSLQLFQVVFSQEDNNRLPCSRAGLYFPEGGDEPNDATDRTPISEMFS